MNAWARIYLEAPLGAVLAVKNSCLVGAMGRLASGQKLTVEILQLGGKVGEKMKKIIALLLFLEVVSIRAHGSEMKAQPQLGSLFLMANDMAAIQKFYGEVLGLKTVGNETEGYLDVNLGVHLTFFKADYHIPVQEEWAWQPGYKGGPANLTSWTIKLAEEDFRKVLNALKVEKVKALNETPEWRQGSYWGITVKDPMGNTLELYSIPEKKPEPPFQWN